MLTKDQVSKLKSGRKVDRAGTTGKVVNVRTTKSGAFVDVEFGDKKVSNVKACRPAHLTLA